MSPWQRADFAGDRTNIRRTPSIRPRPFLQNHVADFRIFQFVEYQFHMPLLIEIVRILKGLNGAFLDLI